jgi:hypothetical protein
MKKIQVKNEKICGKNLPLLPISGVKYPGLSHMMISSDGGSPVQTSLSRPLRMVTKRSETRYEKLRKESVTFSRLVSSEE